MLPEVLWDETALLCKKETMGMGGGGGTKQEEQVLGVWDSQSAHYVGVLLSA